MLCSICAARVPLNQPGFISQTRIVLEGHKTRRNGRQDDVGEYNLGEDLVAFFFFFFFFPPPPPLSSLESISQHSKSKSGSCWPRLILFRLKYKKVTMLTMSYTDTEWENSVFRKKKNVWHVFFLLSVGEDSWT